MNMSRDNMAIKKQNGDISFLIKIINNLLEKYKMNVKARVDLNNTCFILTDGDFSATIGYNSYTENLKIEITNSTNYEFEDDLRKELEEIMILT